MAYIFLQYKRFLVATLYPHEPNIPSLIARRSEGGVDIYQRLPTIDQQKI